MSATPCATRTPNPENDLLTVQSLHTVPRACCTCECDPVLCFQPAQAGCGSRVTARTRSPANRDFAGSRALAWRGEGLWAEPARQNLHFYSIFCNQFVTSFRPNLSAGKRLTADSTLTPRRTCTYELDVKWTRPSFWSHHAGRCVGTGDRWHNSSARALGAYVKQSIWAARGVARSAKIMCGRAQRGRSV